MSGASRILDEYGLTLGFASFMYGFLRYNFVLVTHYNFSDYFPIPGIDIVFTLLATNWDISISVLLGILLFFITSVKE